MSVSTLSWCWAMTEPSVIGSSNAGASCNACCTLTASAPSTGCSGCMLCCQNATRGARPSSLANGKVSGHGCKATCPLLDIEDCCDMVNPPVLRHHESAQVRGIFHSPGCLQIA